MQRVRLIENSDGTDYIQSWGERRTPAVQDHIYRNIPAPKTAAEARRRRREALLTLDSIEAEQSARRSRSLAEGRRLEQDRTYQDWFARTQRARRHWISVLQALEFWLGEEPQGDTQEEETLSGVIRDLIDVLMDDVNGADEAQTIAALRLLRSRL